MKEAHMNSPSTLFWSAGFRRHSLIWSRAV